MNTPFGSRESTIRVTRCARTCFTNLPLMNAVADTTRPPRGWWIRKPDFRRSTHLADVATGPAPTVVMATGSWAPAATVGRFSTPGFVGSVLTVTGPDALL